MHIFQLLQMQLPNSNLSEIHINLDLFDIFYIDLICYPDTFYCLQKQLCYDQRADSQFDQDLANQENSSNIHMLTIREICIDSHRIALIHTGLSVICC